MEKNTEVKFSVLVPVYNAENFLHACIQSVLNQTYCNFELILVDDGSQDGSGIICDQYAQADERVLAFHKANGGQLHAREYAIKKATGEYLVFLDSDDTLKCNALETLAATFAEKQCDFVFFGLVRVRDGAVLEEVRIEEPITITDKRELYRKVLFTNSYNSIGRKAIKATLIQNVRYEAEDYTYRLGEDLLQSLEIYKNCERAVFVPDVLYCYTANPDSITQKPNLDNYCKSIGVREKVLSFVINENVFTEQDMQEYKDACVKVYINELFSLLSSHAGCKEKARVLKNLRKTDYFHNVINRKVAHLDVPFRRRVVFALHRSGCNYLVSFIMVLFQKCVLAARKRRATR